MLTDNHRMEIDILDNMFKDMDFFFLVGEQVKTWILKMCMCPRRKNICILSKTNLTYDTPVIANFFILSFIFSEINKNIYSLKSKR